MAYYSNELTGVSMLSGVGLGGISYTGSTGVVNLFGSGYSGGYGQVYGIYWNTSANPAFGLAADGTGITSSPGITGTIYYPRPSPFGSGISLKFLVTAFSGSVGGVSIALTGDQLIGINSGTAPGSGYILPSGYFIHQESFVLLPNYANPTSQIYQSLGTPYSYTPAAGGFYPSMLNDNIVNINLEITWSGASGDALNC